MSPFFFLCRSKPPLNALVMQGPPQPLLKSDDMKRILSCVQNGIFHPKVTFSAAGFAGAEEINPSTWEQLECVMSVFLTKRVKVGSSTDAYWSILSLVLHYCENESNYRGSYIIYCSGLPASNKQEK